MISLADLDYTSLGNLTSFKKTLCFTGKIIDERGARIVEALTTDNNEIIEVNFDIDNYSIAFNEQNVGVLRFFSLVEQLFKNSPHNDVLIEATTLGFVELLVLLKWFSRTQIKSLKIIYAEPKAYKHRVNYMNDFGRHEFDLSTHSAGFKAVPGFTKAISANEKATLIAALGFERSRLGQLMELDEGAYIESIIPIFGTPGFQVGWDKHSFFQSVDTLKDKGLKPQFVSANSPLDMLNTLNYIKDSLDDKQLMVAPFGPKPLSIGIALFLINNSPDVILKYDHPIKKGDRSNGVGKVHIYSLTK